MQHDRRFADLKLDSLPDPASQRIFSLAQQLPQVVHFTLGLGLGATCFCFCDMY